MVRNGILKDMARKGEVDVWIYDVGRDLTGYHVEMTRVRLGTPARRFWQPRADILETDTGIVVKFEIAGVRRENLQLIYRPETHTLALRGVRIEDDMAHGQKIGVYQLEILSGEFERELRLPPTPIDPNRIQVDMIDGILRVFAPKISHLR